RSRIATRMVESKKNVPHFHATTEIYRPPPRPTRKHRNQAFPEDQRYTAKNRLGRPGPLTRSQSPNLTTRFSVNRTVRNEQTIIGIAVALEGGGLLNVVAKDADGTSISRMAQRNKVMIANARGGKIRPEDVEGSTFTVSNLGPYEVENFIAIINPPEAGIVAVWSAREVPVVLNGELKVGTRMKCTLSADRRVTDGAEGAQFMQAFKTLLEALMRLLI